MKVGAVVFDLGKVLLDFDYGIAARTLARHSTASCEAVRSLIDQSPLLFRYESAGMTSQEFYESVRQQTGFARGFGDFAAAFGNIFTEIRAMTQLQGELNRQGIPTFILSNTNDIAVGHIRRNFPFFARFDDYILSYEHGVLKPQERIYEITEERSGCRGEAIVFLDDRLENVDGAARRGWRTIHHRSPEESSQMLRRWIS